MKEDLTVKGAQGYEHTNTKVASYVSECKGSATLSQCLEVLNSYRKKLLSECTDKEVVEAKKALESARANYNKLATKYVLSDTDYCNLQTEVVRSAVSEYAKSISYLISLLGSMQTEKTYKRQLLIVCSVWAVSYVLCIKHLQAETR